MASQVMRITLKAYDHQLVDQSAGKIIETVDALSRLEMPAGVFIDIKMKNK